MFPSTLKSHCRDRFYAFAAHFRTKFSIDIRKKLKGYPGESVGVLGINDIKPIKWVRFMFSVYKADDLTVLHSSLGELLQVLTTATEFFISQVGDGWDLPSLLHFTNTSLDKIPVLLYNAGNRLRNIKNVSTAY